MNILVLDIVKSDFGGHMTHRIELIENLHKLGHDVHAIVNDEKIAKRMQAKGIIIHRIKINNNFLSLFSCIKTLLHIRYKHQLDIIYGRTSSVSLLGMIIWITQKTKSVQEIHVGSLDGWKQLYSQHCKHNFVRNLWNKFLFCANIFVSKKAAAVRVITGGIKNELIRQGVDGKKIFVIEVGANVETFKPMDVNMVKDILGLDKNIHYVCFVGFFGPWQGVEYLITAAPLIVKEVPKTKFLVVGDGMMREKYFEQVKELNLENKFIFIGIVPYNEVPKYINASDVCVALKAHLKSGYSTVKMYEYLACGKPIVASNEKGLGDVLERTGAGISVNRKNSGEVAKAIIKLIKKKKLREDMGKNGRRLVVKRYSWGITAKRVAELCKQLKNEQTN